MSDAQETHSLLTWYDHHARDLPWRVSPSDRAVGVIPDPYQVWLSEVMLQQTTVAAVKEYFLKFVRLWPNVSDLAAAAEEDVMKAWAGLGYYSRARNLKKCAEVVASEHMGQFPTTEAELLKLPGIGPYTAAAIAAIAFDQRAAVVDGNVERVLSRYFEITEQLPAAKLPIRAEMARLTPSDRSGDFAQAVMDIGATICTPKRPACALCPWMNNCKARQSGTAETLPRKAPKKTKPTRYGFAYVLRHPKNGAVLLQRRPPKGLLGGMSEVPGTEWSESRLEKQNFENAPAVRPWRKTLGIVRHTFTHFHLEVEVLVADAANDFVPEPGQWWSAQNEIDKEALPTVMKKIITHAFEFS